MSFARTSPLRTVPVSKFFLADELKGYRAPGAHLARMQQRGELTRLRRDLYMLLPQDGDTPYSRELIANHLYSPSYVSFESVLADAGLIPERVEEVHSACMGRSRHFRNDTGRYRYTHLPLPYYAIGTRSVRTEAGLYYLAATPEKALCDLIVVTPRLRLQSERALRVYLADDLRVDEERLSRLDPAIIGECAAAAHKKTSILQMLEGLIRQSAEEGVVTGTR